MHRCVLAPQRTTNRGSSHWQVSSIQGLITQLRGSIVSLGKLRARRYSLFLEPAPADEDGACTDDVVQRIALLVAEVQRERERVEDKTSRGALDNLSVI